ncbi:deoxyribodipyrimidine photo-lyase [Rhizobium sp. KVB221]|uniref:Deoxyribodipyrimidine photo-lyase n=1 Tax=Rhizobium setariae TaxID=2801340 RepID=A0A936YRG7_9HYPH|nr:deoxyribodipyrimidine photo-lyase [Rhizobium setariae]MBL0372859.1 deoxyribodipyrimidine photo-lyase [Rhizobium setariae]
MPSIPDPESPAIVWFRRDLRLCDNLALLAAVRTGRPVVCIYIREPSDEFAGALGAAQACWLHHSLHALDQSLAQSGNRLLLRTGNPLATITELTTLTGAASVFWNRRYDADGVRTDTAVKAALTERGIEAKSFTGFLMHEPLRLLTGQNRRYQVYTPFWRAFEAQVRIQDDLLVPSSMAPPENLPGSESLTCWNLLPSNPNWARGFEVHWQPGEAGAQARLDAFAEDSIDRYRNGRDYPADMSTSRLSPHLAMGEISPHRVWNATSAVFNERTAEDVVQFRRQLVWREFSWHLLFHCPDMATANLNSRFDSFAWRGDSDNLSAWQRGMTGYPIVDAGMRELWQTGWMHNRVRMVAASFLIKHLLIDWRQGERWFRNTLLDADQANNAASWQWVAGSGADAAPFFRIFNPIKQGETFDPSGTYVKRYCPELAGLPDRYVHRPFDAPDAVLTDAGVVLGHNYPKPLVSHPFARQRALAAYRATAQ